MLQNGVKQMIPGSSRDTDPSTGRILESGGCHLIIGKQGRRTKPAGHQRGQVAAPGDGARGP